MINMPAICDNCGSIFPSGYVASNSITSFENCKAGMCPVCGSLGHIPDGTYKFISNVIEVLSAPQKSVKELMSLYEIFQKVKDDKITLEKAKEEIKEKTTSYNSLKDLLPHTREEKRSDVKFFAQLIVGLISAIIAFKALSVNSNGTTNIINEQVVNNMYQIQSLNTNASSNIVYNNISRNDICPCGSGLKYKFCHGK